MFGRGPMLERGLEPVTTPKQISYFVEESNQVQLSDLQLPDFFSQALCITETEVWWMNNFHDELQNLSLGDFQATNAVPWDYAEYYDDQQRQLGLIFSCYNCYSCYSCYSCSSCSTCYSCFSCGGRCGGCGGRCGGCGGRCGGCGGCGGRCGGGRCGGGRCGGR